MEITINTDLLNSLAQMNPIQLAGYLFMNGFWVLFTIIIGKFLWDLRMIYIRTKLANTIEYTFLAIDIPRENEQTPKAVEQMFATIAGAHTPLTKGEIYIEGKVQLSFSFEIVSIDGYLQYIVRTPNVYRDLVEAAIYAQYPDAQITEVEDYAKDMPTKFPDEKYNVWGSELILSNKEWYPIKTYPEFEDSISQEFKDPMASILETMNNIKPGEQFWIQIIVIPTGFEWVKKFQYQALKLAGKKGGAPKPGLISRLLSPIFSFFSDWFVNYSTLFAQGEGATTTKKDEMPSMMIHLTPGERNAVEAIERKASKVGFQAKMRIVYIAPREIFQPQRVVSSVFGSIKQFNYNDLNGLKPDNKTKTSAYYGFTKWKKNLRRHRIMTNYINRSSFAGRLPFILNIEELATLYHFPITTVKAPLMPRIESKTSSAPSYLPTGVLPEETGSPKSNLKQELENLKINNDYYKRRYAVNRDQLQPTAKQKINSEAAPKKGAIPDNLPIE